MKTKQEIKDELHRLIDDIDDEHVLNVLNEDVVPYVIENRTKKEGDDEMSEEEEKELDEAIRQADAGEFVSEQEFSMHSRRTTAGTNQSSNLRH